MTDNTRWGLKKPNKYMIADAKLEAEKNQKPSHNYDVPATDTSKNAYVMKPGMFGETLLPGEKSIDLNAVTPEEQAFMDSHSQSMTAPVKGATYEPIPVSDPSVSDSSIANDIHSKNKNDLNNIVNNQANANTNSQPKSNIDNGANNIVSAPTNQAIDVVKSEIDKLDSEKQGMADHAKEVDMNGSEFTDEEKKANLEKEQEIDDKKATYQEQIKTLTNNDSYYNEMKNDVDTIKSRLNVGYEHAPQVDRLVKLKEKALADQEQWNQRAEQISQTNMYHTGSFRYQTSSAINYIKKQQEASLEKIDILTDKYNEKIQEAKDSLRADDMDLLNHYMTGVRNAKKDISDELNNSINYQLNMNKELRDNQKFIMDKGEYQMKMRDAQAQQLGLILAANPGADINKITQDNNWSSLDAGGLALAKNYAAKELRDSRYRNAQINSLNRANQSNNTSPDSVLQKNIETQAKSIMNLDANKGTMTWAEAMQIATKQLSPIGESGVSYNDMTPAQQKHYDRIAKVQSDNDIEQFNGAINTAVSDNLGSLTRGESLEVKNNDEFKKSWSDVEEDVYAKTDYFNLPKDKQEYIDSSLNASKSWIKNNTSYEKGGILTAVDVAQDTVAESVDTLNSFVLASAEGMNVSAGNNKTAKENIKDIHKRRSESSLAKMLDYKTEQDQKK